MLNTDQKILLKVIFAIISVVLFSLTAYLLLNQETSPVVQQSTIQTTPPVQTKISESVLPVTTQIDSVNSEISTWKSYTYSSINSGIFPDIHFKYPPFFGENPTYISSRNTNQPGVMADDWGGFLDFNPTGSSQNLIFRMEFFKRINPEVSLEDYTAIFTKSGDWTSPKYFHARNYRVARLRFASSSHYDADVAWYFIELSDKDILVISTSGNKKYLFDDDKNGDSTRDKIISTLTLSQ